PGGDAAAGQRQEGLVDPGPHTGAGASGEHHTGGPAVQAGGAGAAGLGHAGNRRRPGISRGSPSEDVTESTSAGAPDRAVPQEIRAPPSTHTVQENECSPSPSCAARGSPRPR